jgi:hypothetical protein
MTDEMKDLVHSLGDPPMPTAVWQTQFDGDDAALKRLSYARPGEPVRIQDLLSYCDDLRYVEELQEGLLLRVLPHALHAWRGLLLKDGSRGFSEALCAALAKRREFIAKVLGPEGTHGAARYMAATILELMGKEDSLQHKGSGASPYRWSQEFVSFGCAWDEVELILEPWRALSSPGLAVCTVQYLASLVFTGAENPVFGTWTRDEGGGPVTPWENASGGFEERWSDASVERLRALLAGNGVVTWLDQAAVALKDHPDRAVAQKTAAAAALRGPRLASRTEDLCRHLSTPTEAGVRSWSAETARP